ncbi:MAG: flippase-like domain-containing protein [Sphingobacteriales bacterium JAD_PAG50586_3]|nr:MAG: flippase-like domain-containing protein [Sphingobacteriales bacterium JAD_PAG50586_3]
MNKTLAAVLRYVVFAGIAAGLLWYIFRGQDLGQLLESAKQVNYVFIMASMAVALLGYVIRAKRWNLLLESLGYKTTLLNSSKAVGIGYFANLAFPRLGEVLRCTVLNRTNKIPLNTLIGTVVAERAIDVICLLILIVTVVILRIETLGQYLITNFFNPMGEKIGKLASNPLFIGIAIVGVVAIIVGIRLLITKTNFGAKLKGFIADFTSGLTAVFRLKKIGQFLVLTLLLWTVYFGMMYVCFLVYRWFQH